MSLHALLIGVEQSSIARDEPSSFAVRAVTAMQSYLRTTLDIDDQHLTLLTDETTKVVPKNLTDAFHKIKKTQHNDDNVLLIMFAGHGEDRAGQFLGWGLSEGTFSTGALRDQLEQISFKRCIVIHDCCYGASFQPPTELTLLAPRPPVASRVLRQQRAQRLANLSQSAARCIPVNKTVFAADRFISIGAAGLVSDPGEFLLSALLIGAAASRVSYLELKTLLDTAESSEQKFVLYCERMDTIAFGDIVSHPCVVTGQCPQAA